MTYSHKRADLLLTGQLGLITFGTKTVAEVAVLAAATVRGSGPVVFWASGGGPLVGAQLSYCAAALTALAAAWSSLTRRRRASNALAGLTIGLLIASVVFFQSALPLLSMALVPLRLAGLVWVFAAAICLQRGRASEEAGDAHQFVRSPWLWQVAAPMLVLGLLLQMLGYLAPMAQGLVALLLVACGGLYGLMRRRHPVPGSVSWITPTLVLVAFSALSHLAPVITQLRFRAFHNVSPSAASLAVVLVLLAALAGLRARQRRTSRARAASLDTVPWQE